VTKLAIFVEGQTERVFIERFLIELAGRNNIAIQSRRGFGGVNLARVFTTIKLEDVAGKKYLALIYDSSSDSRVASDIRENYSGLLSQGFALIIGLRDVHPLPREQIPSILKAMKRVIPSGSLRVEIILAIMQIEAWFLAEDSHFQRIDLRLTLRKVKRILSKRGELVPPEQVPCPAETLEAIYSTVNFHYTKDLHKVSSVVSQLDIERMYLELSQSLGSLGKLCRALDDFLSN